MVRKSWPLPLVASFALLGMGLSPDVAQGAVLQCIPRELIFERLKQQDGEVPAHAGVASNGALFEVTVSPDGTWTAFFTFPDGLTCPVATGEGWRPVPTTEDDPAA